MNKKGFAISVILYSIVFLIIAILYMLLGIVKTRYTVNSSLKESIINDLNNEREGYDFLSNEECIITGSSPDFVTDLTLTINVNNGKSYKFDNNSWSSNNTILVNHAGIYIGYFKDNRGGGGSCSIDIKSKTIYRYRDCADDDYLYDEGNNNVIGCKFTKDEQWSDWQEERPTLEPGKELTRQIESRTSYRVV